MSNKILYQLEKKAVEQQIVVKHFTDLQQMDSVSCACSASRMDMVILIASIVIDVTMC